MLPYFIERDLEDVLEELQRRRLSFPQKWFAPHFEFRFPAIGSITKRGIHLELRTRARTLERAGRRDIGGRHRAQRGFLGGADAGKGYGHDRRTRLSCCAMAAACHFTPRAHRENLWPAYATARGSRRRVCTLISRFTRHWCLISWTHGRGVPSEAARITYRIPAGRANEQFPVNAYEAESRRLARFSSIGHTPGVKAVPHEERNPDFPLTLDLRRQP